MARTQQVIGLDQVARQRVAKYAPGTYDHQQQQSLDSQGKPATTSVKDEDAGGSTTFWDGESK
jgi:hypothetical protein